MSIERVARRGRGTATGDGGWSNAGGERERGTEPGQEIDFPGLAGNDDTRSPIVSLH